MVDVEDVEAAWAGFGVATPTVVVGSLPGNEGEAFFEFATLVVVMFVGNELAELLDGDFAAIGELGLELGGVVVEELRGANFAFGVVV